MASSSRTILHQITNFRLFWVFAPPRISPRSHGRIVAKPVVDPLPRALSAAISALYLLLPLGFDQLQHPELLFGDVRQRDRQPDALRVQNSEAPPDQSAARRIHRLFEQVFGTARPMSDVDGLPIRAAAGTTIQLRLR